MAAMVPEKIVDALQATTNELQKAGWSQPPGSQWVEYARPTDAGRAQRSRGPVLRSEGEALPQVARFVLSSPVLPRMVDALPFCSAVHQALVSLSDATLPVFAGKDESGEPFKQHEHVFLLPEIGGDTHRINWLTLYAKMGFDRQARGVLSQFIELWRRGERRGGPKRWGSREHSLRMVLTHIGDVKDFAGTEEFLGQSPLLISSRVWHSVTPFVPTRHPKFKGGKPKLGDDGLHIGSPAHDLCRLLSLNHGAKPVCVEPLPYAMMGGRQVSWLEFQTKRQGGGRRAGHRGYGFRIEFAEEVQGPLALGYGAHFGLGMFAPGEQPGAGQ